MNLAAVAAQGTHDHDEHRIDHSEQIERMLAAYDRPIAKYLDRAELDYTTLEYIRSLVRQAIEEAWEAGHACHRQNNA